MIAHIEHGYSWLEIAPASAARSRPSIDVSAPVAMGAELARVGTTMTTYFWRNGRWVPLASGISSGAAVIGIEATASSDFGHQVTRVAFDNFAVTATKVFCPAGSYPPGA